MGYAVHQVLINLTADAFFFSAFDIDGFRRRFIALINGGFAVEDGLDEFFRDLDAVGDFREDDRFAGKTLDRYVFIAGDDDADSAVNIGLGQVILDTAGTIRFDFDVDAHGSGFVFQGFCCHVGVGNARRAGCDADDVGTIRRSGRFRFSRCFFGSGFSGSFCFFSCDLFGFGLVDDSQVFFRRLGLHQVVAEIVVHEHTAQTAQDFQMDVGTASRSGDEEEQVSRFVVEAFVVDAVADDHRSQARFVDGFRLGVGNGDAFADTRTAFLFTGEDALLVQLFVVQVAAGGHEVDQVVDGSGLVGYRRIEVDALFLE